MESKIRGNSIAPTHNKHLIKFIVLVPYVMHMPSSLKFLMKITRQKTNKHWGIYRQNFTIY